MISSGRPQWAQRRQMDRGPTNAYTAAEAAKGDEQDFQCRRYSDSTEHPMQPMEGPPSRRGLADGRNGYHGEQRSGLGKCSKEKPLGAKNKVGFGGNRCMENGVSAACPHGSRDCGCSALVRPGTKVARLSLAFTASADFVDYPPHSTPSAPAQRKDGLFILQHDVL
ncbi:hypothetical protein SCUP234_01964 [Seiridium cupressi]